MMEFSLQEQLDIQKLDKAVKERRALSSIYINEEHLYDSLASSYDLLYPHDKPECVAFNKRLTRLLKNLNVKKVVDLACGTGRQAISLSQNGFYVVGIDQSSGMLDRCQFQQKTKGSSFQIIKSRWQEIANNFNEKFDAAIMIGDVWSHMKNYQLAHVIYNIYQILKPQGFFIFNARNWDKELLKRSSGNLTAKFSVLNNTQNGVLFFGYEQIDPMARYQQVIHWNNPNKNIRRFWETIVYINQQDNIISHLSQTGFRCLQKLPELSNCLDKYSIMDCFLAIKG